ncbi:hypothetical protein GCM10016455_25300 [Aliiroseovarius zhejiangensis]|uniref:Uncharacterized protein n=1 Tax=Aliiroseovarius zhejiangensis TaxID=1632025 RepID=A0ABQ3J5G9_9RHOB|nr:hypothetical protein [Aliiroseovarius zhejiangensis]GHF02930.1 hypothetical protein GCM10016455_25300 [Aliiroseovarius zhejiangensis]
MQYFVSNPQWVIGAAVRLCFRLPSVDEVVDHWGSYTCDPCRADRTDGRLDDQSPAKGTGNDEAMIEVYGASAPVHLDPSHDGLKVVVF